MRNYFVEYIHNNKTNKTKIFAMNTEDAKNIFVKALIGYRHEIIRVYPVSMEFPYLNTDGDVEYK
jgi:hypothetical protein